MASISFKYQNLFNYFSCLRFIFPALTLSDLIEIQDYESDEKFSIPDDRISHLLPSSYQDMIVRVYSKKPHLVCPDKDCIYFLYSYPLSLISVFLYPTQIFRWKLFLKHLKISS